MDDRIVKLEAKVEKSNENISRLFTGIEVIKESLGNISERLGRVLDVRDDVIRLKNENKNNDKRIAKLEANQLSLLMKVAGMTVLLPLLITIISKKLF